MTKKELKINAQFRKLIDKDKLVYRTVWYG